MRRLIGEAFDASKLEPDENGELRLPGWMRIECATEKRTSQTSASTVRDLFGVDAARGYSQDGESWGLLVEPATTNLVDNQDLSSWTAVNGATVSFAAAPVAPRQLLDQVAAVDANPAATSRLEVALTPGSVVADHTLSAWHRVLSPAPTSDSRLEYLDGVNEPSLLVDTDEASWAFSHATVSEIGSGTLTLIPRNSPLDQGTSRWWGFQLEERAYPTSFIGADDATFERGADTVVVVAEAVAPGGRISMRMKYRPHYAHDETTADHNLLYFSSTARLYFRQSDQRFVLELAGTTLTSDPCTFSRHQELTVRVLHTEVRTRLEVSGATTGDSRATAEPVDAITHDVEAYVLGGPDGAEEGADLTLFAPDLTTFCELVEQRILSQFDDTPGNRDLRDLACILAEQPARIYDVALAIIHGFNLDYARGVQLDMIGSLVGLPREGFDDDRYRDFLKIQVELLLSAARDGAEWTGTSENILRIARRFIGESADPIGHVNQPPYAYSLSVPGLDYAEAFLLIRFLKTATYAGVLGHILISFAENSRWGSSSVAVSQAGKWGSSSVAVSGAAKWGSVVPTE